ncbi:hypothetical protein FRB90_011342 [Tulasnella sp. 427]|nr:hypothetical protein FRB90_011342 [Tulasnella sp. 427]
MAGTTERPVPPTLLLALSSPPLPDPTRKGTADSSSTSPIASSTYVVRLSPAEVTPSIPPSSARTSHSQPNRDSFLDPLASSPSPITRETNPESPQNNPDNMDHRHSEDGSRDQHDQEVDDIRTSEDVSAVSTYNRDSMTKSSVAGGGGRLNAVTEHAGGVKRASHPSTFGGRDGTSPVPSISRNSPSLGDELTPAANAGRFSAANSDTLRRQSMRSSRQSRDTGIRIAASEKEELARTSVDDVNGRPSESYRLEFRTSEGAIGDTTYGSSNGHSEFVKKHEIPRSSYYVGPPAVGSAFGTEPMGTIGTHYPPCADGKASAASLLLRHFQGTAAEPQAPTRTILAPAKLVGIATQNMASPTSEVKQLPSLGDSPASGTSTPAIAPTLNGDNLASLNVSTQSAQSAQSTPRGARFWMVIVAMMVTEFLSAIELTSVAVALPTIVEDLHGTQFSWVGAAFSLGSTAVLPLTGGLAQIFGRRPIVLGSIAFFAAGSGICGGATSMGMLIAGRAIQGIGGGGILSLSDIVVADLVPLSERGNFIGIFGAVWAIASAIGPPIGGAFSQSNWRWLFYMNLPLTGFAAILALFSLHLLKGPSDDTLGNKMRRLDLVGNAIVIASTTISIVALTWAGIQHPWTSAAVLVPLILGLLGLGVFFVYEAKVPIEPVVPWELINNRTSLLGYVSVFLHGIISTAVIYYLPLYFQTALEQGPVKSGISMFGNAFTIAPGAIAAGATAAIFSSYRPQNAIGWVLTSVGVGLLSLLKSSSSKAEWIGYQLIEGIGLGFLFTAPQFPVLAPLPVTETAHALAFFTFIRSFAQTWGVTIGATILQNELKQRLPQAFLEGLDSSAQKGIEITYAAVPLIHSLEEPIKTEVKKAFVGSLRVIWLVMAGIGAAGILVVFGMKDLVMHEVTNEDWGLKEEDSNRDEEEFSHEKPK